MKLRIKGNSVRLRLQRSEVEVLHSKGRLEDFLCAGESMGGKFTYILRTVSESVPYLQIQSRSLVIAVPVTWAEEMHSSSRVGFTEDIISSDASSISLTVEKDFKRLVEKRGEDESDAYLNPDTEVNPVDSNQS